MTITKEGLRETGSRGKIVLVEPDGVERLFYVMLDRKKAPFRGAYRADEIEIDP